MIQQSFFLSICGHRACHGRTGDFPLQRKDQHAQREVHPQGMQSSQICDEFQGSNQVQQVCVRVMAVQVIRLDALRGCTHQHFNHDAGKFCPVLAFGAVNMKQGLPPGQNGHAIHRTEDIRFRLTLTGITRAMMWLC